MDIKDIQNLIKFVAKSGAQEVKLEMEDIKITIKTGSSESSTNPPAAIIQQLPPTPVSAPPVVVETPAESAPTKVAKETDSEAHLLTVKSPIIGTFYRRTSPDKPVLVEVGSTINKGDVICVIEAMKLFNEIESEVNGKVVKILVDDSSPVEFDQPLFVIEPA